MTFAARMTRALRDGAGPAGGPVPRGLAAPVAGLAGAAAEASPYLAGLLGREGGWLGPALDDPEAAVAAELAAIAAAPPDLLAGRMRLGKARLALLVALADLGGVWGLEEVTGTLTRLAETCTAAALAALAARAGPGGGADTLTVFAMGKMGAGELNYSSDIDLICLFDGSRLAGPGFEEARARLVRLTRRLAATLSERTAEGYVFRTDLRLRPDAGVMPVALSMEAALAYYEAEGRTWERAAWIKGRPVAGDLEAGARFLEELRPFVWRRHLDFAAIEDAHAIRLRLRARHHGRIVPGLAGQDIKLGPGGIREIEFFTQTRQLIAGGRDPALRARGTEAALAALVRAGWVGADVADVLRGHYRALRMLEHRLQMVHDAQTHAMPATAEGLGRVAALSGTTPAALVADITRRLEEVREITDSFFAPAGGPAPPPGEPGPEPGVMHGWPHYPALRSGRARAIFRRLEPAILARLAAAARPEAALAEFDRFLAGLPAGVQLFALFEANPKLTELIVDICASAPALAQHLSRHAQVLDAVLDGEFFAPWPGEAGLGQALDPLLAAAGDHEARLDAARRFMRDWHFRIGVHHLRGLTGADEAGVQYADLARAVVAALWPRVAEEVARRHGPAPGGGAVVLAMGSLGAGRLSATSDLDLLVIHDAPEDGRSAGPRPLAARRWYAVLTRALVTALSAPTAAGRLYEVDMRLRPSGRQGPVATSLAAFGRYQAHEAWTWEHLALTRARVIAGPPDLAARVETLRQRLIAAQAGRAGLREDVARMRALLAANRAPPGPLGVETGPGRLMEIELAAALLALDSGSPARAPEAQVAAGARAGLVDAADAAALAAGAGLFRRLQAAARLTGGPAGAVAEGAGARELLLREGGKDDEDALAALIADTAGAAARAIDRLLE